MLSRLFGGGSAGPKSSQPSALVLFSGLDADLSSRFVSGGFKARPLRRLGVDHFIVMGAVGTGAWHRAGLLAVGRESDSRNFRAHLMAGAELPIGGGSLGLFGGLEFFRETGRDPLDVAVRGDRRFGLRAQVDWWKHPTPETLFTVSIVGGTAKPDLWSRFAWGWKIPAKDPSWGFVGPEGGISASRDSVKARIGAHWSEWGAAGFRFRLSGGVSKETGRRAGFYGALGGYRAF